MAELFSRYFVNIADGVPEITEQSYGKELDAHPSIQAIFNNNEQLAVRNLLFNILIKPKWKLCYSKSTPANPVVTTEYHRNW